jgi:hypothetical protein
MRIDRNAFPSEWELDEWEKKQKESRHRTRSGKASSLTENEQRLDNRDAWALQEDRHYQWLEDEYNGVKHRHSKRQKKTEYVKT